MKYGSIARLSFGPITFGASLHFMDNSQLVNSHNPNNAENKVIVFCLDENVVKHAIDEEPFLVVFYKNHFHKYHHSEKRQTVKND